MYIIMSEMQKEIHDCTHSSQGWGPKWLCLLHEKIDMPEQALGWFPLGLGLVMEDEPSELSCIKQHAATQTYTYQKGQIHTDR